MKHKLLAILSVLTLIATFATTLPARAAITNASDLRVALDSLLAEHVQLAASATNAALGGRDDEFTAAAAALDTNSVDLSKAIGAVYGKGAEDAFLPLWRKHIGFFVDYTQGVAAKDQAKQDKAIADLVQYTQDFGAFLNSANPNLPKDAVADLVKTHALGLKDVVDAQASGDQAKAFMGIRTASAHMDMIAGALAGGIVQQFPDKFAGKSDSADVMLRNTLNLGLQEHTFLAASATNAALGGRDAEFTAAAGALDANSVDLSKAIGSVYGKGAEDAFLPLWRKHIGFFVDYTQATAAKDKTKQDKAVADLVQYTQDFGAFLNSASPALPKDAVADLVKTHVLTLKDVVDAQASGDQTKAYTALRAAYAHMSMVADPLAATIVAQFPDKFGAAPATAPAAGSPAAPAAGTPATMPNTSEGGSLPFAGILVAVAAVAIAGSLLLRRNRRAI
jgi:hypothetical protein